VNVRKGIHYLVDAARLLQDENVRFDVVGPIGIFPDAVAAAPGNITFHGPVSRDRAEEWYRQADVFVLPTLSDGFALTQLEALAHGVPLITTPRCGRVVEDGKTGFIVPAQDAPALAEAILRFVRAPELAGGMESACREAVKAYSIDAYGSRLLEIIHKHQSAATSNLPMGKIASEAP
jgi:glycosyltransferase involved in cell wall biosynthesis